MEINFLGTNGWYAANSSNTICTLVESEEYYIVFDAGDGIYKLDKFIKKDKPIYLFLSHLHLDHIIGFHIFAKFSFKNTVNIILQKGNKKKLSGIIKHPFSAPFKDRKFKVVIEEISRKDNKLPFAVDFRKLQHPSSTLGYRIHLDGKIITYCCDTEICKSSFELSKDADILIHECSRKSKMLTGGGGHSNPEEVAELAKKANAKKLVLTHLTASNYITKTERKISEKSAKKIFPKTIVAEDDLRIKI